MIHVITGQTATGKTKRAIELAHKLDGEIINFDARQIYKKLNIITGKDLNLTTGKYHLWKKDEHREIGYYEISNDQPSDRPTPDLQAKYAVSTHNSQLNTRLWLYDIVDPSYSFSAVEYAALALTVIENIMSRGKTPILVGGTYFYLQQLLYNTVKTIVEPDQELRDTLQRKPITELQKMLSEKNLILFRSLNNSERNNPQRLIRRIEIELSAKKTQHEQIEFPYEYKIEGYYYESKSYMREHITKRVAERIKAGAINEVTRLVQEGYDAMSPGLATIGYKQVLSHLNGQLTQKEMVKEWITREMQYAKRQLTFMKRDEHILWYSV